MFSAFELDATVSLAGDPLNTTYPTLTFNNALKIKEEVFGFILYITKVPYKSYWNSTTSVKLGANTAKYEFKEFQGNANYRITLAVIHEEILDDGYPHPLRFKETSKYVKNFFSPSEDFKFVTKKRLDQHSVFSRNPVISMSLIQQNKYVICVASTLWICSRSKLHPARVR